MSRQVSALLELRRTSRALRLQVQERAWYEEQLVKFSDALELANADLNEQARLDPLTGLANRRTGRGAGAGVGGGSTGCLALLDIDHFKAINDTHGHPAGDECWCRSPRRCRATSAGHGLLARHGGEEFAWLLPEVDLAQATLQCELRTQGGGLRLAGAAGHHQHRRQRPSPGDTVGSGCAHRRNALRQARGPRPRTAA